MLNLLRKLWRDEIGQVQIAGALLLCVVIAIGAIVGLTTLRDQLVQEFGDIAVSLESLNQSFTTSAVTHTDPPTTLTDPAGLPPACLSFQPASGE